MSSTEPLPNTNPLFTALVNENGQITIRSDVRKRKGIVAGDSVEVYDIRKVVK